MGQRLRGDGPPVEQGNGRPGASFPQNGYRPEGAELVVFSCPLFHCNLSRRAEKKEHVLVGVSGFLKKKKVVKLSNKNDLM